MKPMRLAEVRKHTGRQLAYADAVKLANPGDPFLRNMPSPCRCTPGTTRPRTDCASRRLS